MPTKKRIQREDILKAAVQVIRREGPSALTMRRIAAQVGCSTQPLYSEFGGQEQLLGVLCEYIRAQYLAAPCCTYRDFGRLFLQFAGQEKELFCFLYLRKRAPGQTLVEDANFNATLHLLQETLEISHEQAAELHHRMQYYCYGLGTMIATGYRTMSPEEIDRELAEFFCLLLEHYKHADNKAALIYWLERSRYPMLSHEGGTYGKTQNKSL